MKTIMKRILLLLIICTAFTSCNKINKNKKLEGLKNENSLIEEICSSVKVDYDKWVIYDNAIINYDKHIKVLHIDSTIYIMAMDDHNVKEEIVASVSYNTSYVQINRAFNDLESIQKSARITKIYHQLKD